MAKKKILIVDDEPDILKLASLRLKKLGYDVIMAVNGKEALDIMRDEKPDLILLDLILPVMNGADVCKKTKNDEKLKHIPIILFTAQSDTMTAEKAKEFGANDYITKPFDPEELRGKVEEILAQGAIS
jgi:two-component system alkaline phosphatase synthesis response regulator PhoP